jgi:ferredoxin
MDISALSPEVIKTNNPGLNDFASGNIVALTSQCLRAAGKPTECNICVDFCPLNTIDVKITGRPRINMACIKCGACIGACPTNALASSKRTLHQINRLALTAALRVEHLAITCERTAAVLRLATLDTEDAEEKSGPTPGQKAARIALDLLQKTITDEHVQVVPCLGMIPREIWFSILNEIGITKLEALSVFLPTGLCAECPVNEKNNVEDMFAEAITTAEAWTGQSVGIITDPRDLPEEHKANVRAYLTSDLEMDRRGAFTGFLKELKDTWEENSQVGNRAQEEVRIQRERRETFDRTRLSSDIKKQKPGSKKPIDVPTRRILVEALGRNDAHASEVVLTVSATDAEACTLCETCVLVCPLRARAIEEPVVEAVEVETDAPEPAPVQEPAEEPTPDTRKVVVNDLYCVGCSACIQACPTGACSFAEIKGSSYLDY